MSAGNLVTVIAFEVRRTLTKPLFWLTALSAPLLIVGMFVLMFLSQNTAFDAVQADRDTSTPFTYTDASGIVVPEVAAALGGTPTEDATGAAQAVHQGRSAAHIDVPGDPQQQPVRVTARDEGPILSGRWGGLASDLVQGSAAHRLGNPQLTALLDRVPVTTELWRDGERSPGLAAAVLPGLSLALLYLAVLMLGNRMLTITVEEKENRVTEMILTTMDPTALIGGKIIAVLVIGIAQAVVFVTPVVIAASVLGLSGASFSTPGASEEPPVTGLEGPVLDPAVALVCAALFVAGFLLYTALLVLAGSVMPTVKDASNVFVVVLVLLFVPVYAAPAFLAVPDGAVAQFLTWFPLTAPVTTLMRLAFDAVSPATAAGVAALTLVVALGLLALSVRLFGRGAISYDKRVGLRDLVR